MKRGRLPVCVRERGFAVRVRNEPQLARLLIQAFSRFPGPKGRLRFFTLRGMLSPLKPPGRVVQVTRVYSEVR
jgi:hypothetical protein